MSESEKKESKGAGGALDSIKNVAGTIGKLKQENPKVLYGGIAAVVIGLFILMTSGDGTISTTTEKRIVIGQSYTVRNPNGTTAEGGDTLLVPVPGTVQAYDTSDKSDQVGCPVPAGSRATALEQASGYGVAGLYVKLRVEDGKCAGQEGWTTISNLE